MILVCVCGWHKIGWKETKHWSDVEGTQQRSWFGRTNIIPRSCIPGMHPKTMRNKQRYCWQLQNHVRIQNFRRSNWKFTELGKNWVFLRGPTMWKVMPRNAWNVIVNQLTKLVNDFIKYQLHVLMTINPKKKNWNPWEKCQMYALNFLKSLYLARIGGPHSLWSVNKLARAITKWTRACDKRWARSISYIHFTSECKQYCHVGNTAPQCRLGPFQDADFADDLEDSKSTPGGTLCIFGGHTFVPISWMCKKQTCESHGSKESEIIYLWMQVYAWTVFPRLICGIWSLMWCIQNRVKNRMTSKHGVTRCMVKPPRNNCILRLTIEFLEDILNCPMSISFPQTRILLRRELSCISLKTTKLWSRWSSKAEVLHRDMFQDPLSCSCLVVRQNQLGHQDPNQIQTNSQTF